MSFEQNTWSDFDIELKSQNDGDIQRDTDVDAIKNSLKNIISTLQGSRRMLPPFATNLEYLLFEPITPTTAYHIAHELIESINAWDDRVQIIGIDVIPNPDQNRYDCKMKFNIINNETTTEIDFILKQE